MSNPLYAINDVVYLKESAAIGFMEPARITGIHYISNSWMYTINMTNQLTGGNKQSLVNGAALFFTEDEFVSLCDGLTIAEANAQRTLTRIQEQRAQLCG